MRSPNSIQVLLRVRCQREEIEERKLVEIIKKLKLAYEELESVSTELEHITAARLKDIQCISPNTHHQAQEGRSRVLWRRCADQGAEIERLKAAQAQQMSAYLSAHRDREVMENLNKLHRDAFEAERSLREQKLNEDLFLARKVAKWDM